MGQMLIGTCIRANYSIMYCRNNLIMLENVPCRPRTWYLVNGQLLPWCTNWWL